MAAVVVAAAVKEAAGNEGSGSVWRRRAEWQTKREHSFDVSFIYAAMTSLLPALTHNAALGERPGK